MSLSPQIAAEGSLVSVISLDIARINACSETQTRVSRSPGVVEDYAELMRSGTQFPPVRTWFDGAHYWLTDGFQRIEAAKHAQLQSFDCEVHFGSLEDALWDSFSVNATNGLRRTNEDIKAIVGRALSHPRALRLSTNQLAKHGHPRDLFKTLE